MTDQEILSIYQDTIAINAEQYMLAVARTILSRAIPEGHVVVPKRPTRQMLIAAGFDRDEGEEQWAAMLEAAPPITIQTSGVSEEKINAVEKLLLAAEDHFDYGGSEDSDGVLYPGHVDFPKLRADVRAVLAAAPTNKEKT